LLLSVLENIDFFYQTNICNFNFENYVLHMYVYGTNKQIMLTKTSIDIVS